MKKKERKTLKDELEGWLVFNEYWFWDPRSGWEGTVIVAIIITAALVVLWP